MNRDELVLLGFVRMNSVRHGFATWRPSICRLILFLIKQKNKKKIKKK